MSVNGQVNASVERVDEVSYCVEWMVWNVGGFAANGTNHFV